MKHEELHEKMKSYLKTNPQLAFVIMTSPNEDHARHNKAKVAWLAYLDANGLKKTASTWRMIWNGGGKAVTVPTEDPCIFDMKYNPDYNAPRRPYGARGRARDISEAATYRPE